MMVAERERATVFGEVADLYQRARPSYPSALVEAVLESVETERPRVLEVGSGTGKATVLFSPNVEHIVCVEPDPAMATAARSVLEGVTNVEIVTGRFEDWVPGDDRFDLVISAQAWHWVEADAGVRMARGALVDGGAIAVFWNRPLSEGDPLREPLDAAYREIAPEIADDQWFNKTILDVATRAESIGASDAFGPVQIVSFPWSTTYSTAEYVDLLLTYSNHRLLEPSALERLLAEVRRIVDAAGGVRPLRYEAVLCVAKTR
jgi:SAM-dependent methyltransferase